MAFDGDLGVGTTFLVLKYCESILIFYSSLGMVGNNNKNINVHIKVVRKN